MRRAEPRQTLEAVELRQADVEQDDLGRGLPGPRKHLAARAHFGDDLEVAVTLELEAVGPEDQRVVVG